MQSRTETPLVDKIALVTGASRRIGRAIALELAESGADVVVHARQAREEVEVVADEIRSLGRQSLVVLGDISSEPNVRTIFTQIEEAFGGIDFLVNNAAIRAERPFLDLSLEEWRQIMGVILDGTFLCSREALRSMVARGGGCIVNIGGVTAHVGAPQRAHVSSAKAGVVGLTRALAVEFAKYDIRVNCVVPGLIGGARSPTAGPAPNMPKNTATLLDRSGRPDEVAHMVMALCAPAAGYVTGQTIHVNGGMFMS